jgi:starch synthase
MRIAFVASEAVPYAKTGGLADVAGALTRELARRGHEVALFLPRYADPDVHTKSTVLLERDLTVPLGARSEPLEISSTTTDGVQVFFVGHDAYFRRPELYRDPATGSDWHDNDMRYLFFSKAVLEICEHRAWYPDIIHANDWQSGPLLAFLELEYRQRPSWANTRTLFTVHNIAYQGLFGSATFERFGLEPAWWYPGSPFEYWNNVNFLKVGLEFAESISTVSPRYAREIAGSNEFGFGMEGILQQRSADLAGITNGIDYDLWNPDTDPHLPAHFSRTDPSGKRMCKEALKEEVGLPPDDVPLLGIISRLVDQKGFDLVEEVADELLSRPLQMVLLGTGDARYHEMFERLQSVYPDRIRAELRFDDGLAHRIEAGSDMFLMPSRYEPCGLNQLYSLRYGTIPVVRATGGLADTVKPYGEQTGTGFQFQAYDAREMLAAIDAALNVYNNRDAWLALMDRAMAADFSWPAATLAYEDLYRRTCERPRRSLTVQVVG